MSTFQCHSSLCLITRESPNQKFSIKIFLLNLYQNIILKLMSFFFWKKVLEGFYHLLVWKIITTKLLKKIFGNICCYVSLKLSYFVCFFIKWSNATKKFINLFNIFDIKNNAEMRNLLKYLDTYPIYGYLLNPFI